MLLVLEVSVSLVRKLGNVEMISGPVKDQQNQEGWGLNKDDKRKRTSPKSISI